MAIPSKKHRIWVKVKKNKVELTHFIFSLTCVTMEMWLRMRVVSWRLQQYSELKIISTRCSVSVRPFSLSHSTTCSSRNCMAGFFTDCCCSVSVNLSSTSVCEQKELRGWELTTCMSAGGRGRNHHQSYLEDSGCVERSQKQGKKNEMSLWLVAIHMHQTQLIQLTNQIFQMLRL